MIRGLSLAEMMAFPGTNDKAVLNKMYIQSRRKAHRSMASQAMGFALKGSKTARQKGSHSN